LSLKEVRFGYTTITSERKREREREKESERKREGYRRERQKRERDLHSCPKVPSCNGKTENVRRA
jgi:hypothetical protein